MWAEEDGIFYARKNQFVLGCQLRGKRIYLWVIGEGAKVEWSLEDWWDKLSNIKDELVREELDRISLILIGLVRNVPLRAR